MIGNNTMKLNEATVKAALQMYFDSKFIAMNDAPEIVSVTCDGNGFLIGTTQKPAIK